MPAVVRSAASQLAGAARQRLAFGRCKMREKLRFRTGGRTLVRSRIAISVCDGCLL